MARLIHSLQNLTATKTLFNFNGDLNTLPFYKILIGFLFCIFLGGCSGSSNSSSSTNDNSSAEEKEEEKTQPKKCKVENGVAKLKDGECKITACNAGYLKGEIVVDNDGPGTDDGNSALDRQCTSPSAGKYTDDGIAEKNCDDDSTPGTAPFTIPNGAYKKVAGFPVPNENSCPFTCNDGYIKTDEEGGTRSCSVPDPGYYADANGDKQTCGDIVNSKQVGGDLVTSAGSVTVVLASDKCPFACETGYVKDDTTADAVSTGLISAGRSCSIPLAGMYADADGKARQCNKIADGDGDDDQGDQLYASFEDNTGPVSDPYGCPFTCESGTRPAPINVEGKLLQPRVCNVTGVGVYTKNVNGDNVVTQCTPIKYISRWLALASPPLTTDTCDYECQAGYLKGEIAADDDGPGADDTNTDINRQCTSPAEGKYTADGIAQSDCTAITDGAFKQVAGFPVPNENSCPFTCSDGYIKTDEEGGTRSCSVPDPGYYADANGDKQTCGDIVNSKQVGGDLVTSAGSVTVVEASDKCPFTCETGYVKDETARTCALPRVGYYADANGAAVECTKIVNGSLVDSGGPVEKANGCPFICYVGYVKNKAGRTCTVPADGYYADVDGNLQECTTEKSDIDYVNEIGAITQVGLEVADAANCPFNCLPGFIPDFNNRACAELGTGKFSDSLGQEGDCGGKPASSPGWTATQPVSVTQAAKCEFECNAGRTPDPDASDGTGSDSICAVNPGYAVLADDGSPGDPTGDRAASPCTHGYVPNVAKNACIAPPQGYFALRVDGTTKNADGSDRARDGDIQDEPGIQTACNAADADTNNVPDHPVTSTGWVTAQVSEVNMAADCAFECATGVNAAVTRSPVGRGTYGSCDVPAGHIVAAGPTTSPNPATTCNIVISNVRQVPNDYKTVCEDPDTGYFSDLGVETTCNVADTNNDQIPDHPVTSTGWVATQSNTVNNAGDCAFNCSLNHLPTGTGISSSCVRKVTN